MFKGLPLSEVLKLALKKIVLCAFLTMLPISQRSLDWYYSHAMLTHKATQSDKAIKDHLFSMTAGDM